MNWVFLASVATLGYLVFTSGEVQAAVNPADTSAKPTSNGGSTSRAPRRGGSSTANSPQRTGFNAKLQVFQQRNNAWQLGIFEQPADPLAARSGRAAPILAVDGLWGTHTAAAFQRIARDLGIVARTPSVVTLLAETRAAGPISPSETRAQIMRLAEAFAAVTSAADWQRTDQDYLNNTLRSWTTALSSCCGSDRGVIADTIREGRGTSRDLRISTGRAFRPGAQ